MIVLVDTNILLDVIQNRTPHSGPAAKVWKLVEERSLVGYVSAISFNNVFYVAKKQLGVEKALAAIRLIRQIFQVVPLDEQVLDFALASPGNDFEDAIQAAAALRINANYVVTRNLNDFAQTKTPAVTAEELLAVLLP